ncbi:MAG TPA: hypothetical protein DCF63_07790 [Planctomycetaceae bacterium]|nr:hypothetical protein [Planctomycetaceae bacterium]
MDWKNVKHWLVPSLPELQWPLSLPAGLRHYRRERNGQLVRMHLRVEHSGQALLLAAATEAVRLTQVGAITAYGILEGHSDQQITQYLAGSPDALEIINSVRDLIDQLGLPNKRYPIFNLLDTLDAERPLGLVAPFQADVEVGDPGATKIYLQKLWAAGIPHVRFVQSDAKDCSDQFLASLCGVVDYAESIGMIAGVRLPASRLMQQDATNQRSAIDQLAELGLDYVVVPWAVNKPCHHQVFGSEDLQCLDNLIERTDHWEIPVVLESGLIPKTMVGFAEHLEPWVARGIQYVEVFAVASVHADTSGGQSASEEAIPWSVFPACHLRQLACWTEDLADNRNIHITWLPPQTAERTDSQNSIIEILRAGPRTGGDVCVRIDLEGNLYTARGPYISIGKIHQSPWSELWNHPCFGRYRDLVCHHDHCQQCTFLTVCATHCPADPDSWAAGRRTRIS